MATLPKIPTRTFYHGNKKQAKKHVGMGRKRFNDLVTDASFNSLPTSANELKLSDGSIIQAYQNHGVSEIHITAPIVKEDIEEPKECKCGKYFTEGVVVGAVYVEGYHRAAYLYTVDVCQAGSTQVTVQNCVSGDFREYNVGDSVWCCLSPREIIPGILYNGSNWYDDSSHAFFDTYYGKIAYQMAWGAPLAGYSYEANTTEPQYEVSWNMYTRDAGGTQAYYLSGFYPGAGGSPPVASNGLYPDMCSYLTILDDEDWVYNFPFNAVDSEQLSKNYYSVTNPYNMAHYITGIAAYPVAPPGAPDDFDPLAMRFPFNLKLTSPTVLGVNAHTDYEIKLAQVVKLDHVNNTVNLKIIKDARHYAGKYQLGDPLKYARSDDYYYSYDTIEIPDENGDPQTVDYFLNNVPVKIMTQVGAYLKSIADEDEEVDVYTDAWSVFLNSTGYDRYRGENTNCFTSQQLRLPFTSNPQVAVVVVPNIITDLDNSGAKVIGAWEKTAGVNILGGSSDYANGRLCFTQHILPAKRLLLGTNYSCYDILNDTIINAPQPRVHRETYYFGSPVNPSGSTIYHSQNPPAYHATEFERIYDRAYQTNLSIVMSTRTYTTFNGDIYEVDTASSENGFYFEAAGMDVYVWADWDVTGPTPADISIRQALVKLPGVAAERSTVLENALYDMLTLGLYLELFTIATGQMPDDDFVLTGAL